jgi:hypothetical protein
VLEKAGYVVVNPIDRFNQELKAGLETLAAQEKTVLAHMGAMTQALQSLYESHQTRSVQQERQEEAVRAVMVALQDGQKEISAHLARLYHNQEQLMRRPQAAPATPSNPRPVPFPPIGVGGRGEYDLPMPPSFSRK